jgi:glyoxylase-like metal-dependent hydrolase (beta-lactamase superfamily II)
MAGIDSGPGRKEAIIIDPGSLDEALINAIEKNKYKLVGILLTHNHANHVNGIRSLKRIYDVDIYAANHTVLDYTTNLVKDNDVLELGNFSIKVISTPGHSIDSVVYKVDHIMFSGDVLSAGLMGKTDSAYGAMRQIAMIQNKIFTQQGNCVVLPGHGPPTSLKIERKYNIGIGLFQENRNKTQRNSFNLEFLD